MIEQFGEAQMMIMLFWKICYSTFLYVFWNTDVKCIYIKTLQTHSFFVTIWTACLQLRREYNYPQWNESYTAMSWKTLRQEQAFSLKEALKARLKFPNSLRNKPWFLRHILWSDETKTLKMTIIGRKWQRLASLRRMWSMTVAALCCAGV